MEHKQDSKSPAKREQPAAPDEDRKQQTWAGGGSEPLHPDDIGHDGESLGRQHITRPTRSDDN